MKIVKYPFFIILLCSFPAWSQTDEKAAYIRENYTKMERSIPMRDGVRLFTAIYTPRDQTRKYPILIVRTPYSVNPYGENKFPNSLSPSMLFVKEGYIFVYQDVRGRWMSEGEFVNVRPYNPGKKNNKDVDESSDTYDTVDWLIKNLPANNGRVGIYGVSYPGFYATSSLPGAHPAVKAVSPQAPVTDWFIGDDWHHNGAFMLNDAFNFYSSFGMPRPKPITPDKGPRPIHYGSHDGYKFFLDLGPLKNVNARYFGDSIGFWNEMMEHGTYDAFWKSRNIRPHLTGIKPATLVVGGFFDAEDCFGALHTYEAIERQNPVNHNTLVMGPWFHGGWHGEVSEIFCDIKSDQPTSTWYQENVEFPFFQSLLNNKPDPGLPEALVFETGTNQWRRYDAWPPKNSVQKNLYFHEKGILSFTISGETTGFDEYISDPNKPVPYDDGIHQARTREYMFNDQRFASRRPDVMVYQTDILADDITLAGPVVVNLTVSTSGTDADYVVKLIDVYPDDYPNPEHNPGNIQLGGFQMLVRGEIMRGKFRNSFENPEPFVPGNPTLVKYNMTDVAHCFRKGHRIMIQVQNSWFPLVDRNPQKFTDIYHADETDFQKATQRIYHDKTNSSFVTICIVQ